MFKSDNVFHATVKPSIFFLFEAQVLPSMGHRTCLTWKDPHWVCEHSCPPPCSVSVARFEPIHRCLFMQTKLVDLCRKLSFKCTSRMQHYYYYYFGWYGCLPRQMKICSPLSISSHNHSPKMGNVIDWYVAAAAWPLPLVLLPSILSHISLSMCQVEAPTSAFAFYPVLQPHCTLE